MRVQAFLELNFFRVRDRIFSFVRSENGDFCVFGKQVFRFQATKILTDIFWCQIGISDEKSLPFSFCWNCICLKTIFSYLAVHFGFCEFERLSSGQWLDQVRFRQTNKRRNTSADSCTWSDEIPPKEFENAGSWYCGRWSEASRIEMGCILAAPK